MKLSFSGKKREPGEPSPRRDSRQNGDNRCDRTETGRNIDVQRDDDSKVHSETLGSRRRDP
jgi:hypothetical protein